MPTANNLTKTLNPPNRFGPPPTLMNRPAGAYPGAVPPGAGGVNIAAQRAQQAAMGGMNISMGRGMVNVNVNGRLGTGSIPSWPFQSNPQQPPPNIPPVPLRQQFPPIHQQTQIPGGPSVLSQQNTQQEILDMSEFPALGTSTPTAAQPPTPGGSSYASTAGLTGTGSDMRMNILAGIRDVGIGGSAQLNAITGGPSEFSIDDFPALPGSTPSNGPNRGVVGAPVSSSQQPQHYNQQLQGVSQQQQQQQQPQQLQQQQQQQPDGAMTNLQAAFNNAGGGPGGHSGVLQTGFMAFQLHGQQGQQVAANGRVTGGPISRPSISNQNVSLGKQSYATKASTPIQQSISSPQPIPSPAVPPSPSTSTASASTIGGTGSNSSAADGFGLLGLLGVIRMTDPDLSMLALGSDLTTLGLNLNAPEALYSTFTSPWSDTQTTLGLNIEPEYNLPACYNVQQAPSPQSKIRGFSDETLFYIFYSMPRDVLQEVAAQELFNRNWRYHKELHMWLTKEENTEPFTKTQTFERGNYIIFDPSIWEKVKKDHLLMYEALEERAPVAPVTSGMGPGGVPPGVGVGVGGGVSGLIGTSVGSGVGQLGSAGLGSFSGVGGGVNGYQQGHF